MNFVPLMFHTPAHPYTNCTTNHVGEYLYVYSKWISKIIMQDVSSKLYIIQTSKYCW